VQRTARATAERSECKAVSAAASVSTNGRRVAVKNVVGSSICEHGGRGAADVQSGPKNPSGNLVTVFSYEKTKTFASTDLVDSVFNSDI